MRNLVDLTDFRHVRRFDFAARAPALRRGRPPFPSPALPIEAPDLRWCMGQYSGSNLPGQPTGTREGQTQPQVANINNQDDVWPNADALALMPEVADVIEHRPGEGLLFRSRRMPERVRALLPPGLQRCSYVSGALDSYPYAVGPGTYVEVAFSLAGMIGPGSPFWCCPVWLMFLPGTVPAVPGLPDIARYSEIDAVEVLFREPHKLHQTLHTSGVTGRRQANGEGIEVLGRRRRSPDPFAGEVRCGAHFGRDRIRWTVNGEVTREVPTTLANSGPHRLILNMAVGGSWAGKAGPDSPDEAQMLVRSVDVWREDAA